MKLLGARRALRVSGGTLAGLLACVAVGAGGLRHDGAPGALGVVLLAGLVVLLLLVITRRLAFEPPSARAQRASFWLGLAPALADVEVALALVASVYAVVEISGGASSPAYPLLYGVVAFSVTFQSRAGAWLTLIAVFALEAAALLSGPITTDRLVVAATHGVFLVAAASAHTLFLRALVARQMRRRQRALERALEEQQKAARDYRLISAALGAQSRGGRTRAEEERLLAGAGVHAISAAIFYTLSLIKRALDAHTCVLLWLDEGGSRLTIKEVVTDTDDVTGSRVIPAAGVVGAICRDRKPLHVPYAKPSQLPYYDSGELDGAFVGVPVLDGPHLRGVLGADREVPFDARDVELLAGATEQILRTIQSEQVFLAVERAKYEHERFYQASAMLCQALTLEQVMDTAFDAAAEIVGYDAAAITIYDREQRRHRVYAVRVAPGAEKLLDAAQLSGLEFRDNAGLAAMVVKNKHFLPAGGELRDVTSPVFTKKIKLSGAESLLVLPLLSADEAIGTFMLASRRRGHFGKDVREMLGIIANQVAVSLQNGMMYKKMETMATTDGLTGLTNHRTFQERFAQLLDRAERHGHQAAVLLCDVDHFKKVNDTYGHPIGDEVLRQVARVLREAVRKIDIPARYGGEEFAVVLEATDLAGAKHLAERIRTDVGALSVDSDQGPFQVTMSIGVAAFPADGRDRAQLIEHADMALYHAKESGRNRVVTYQAFDAARRARRAS